MNTGWRSQSILGEALCAICLIPLDFIHHLRNRGPMRALPWLLETGWSLLYRTTHYFVASGLLSEPLPEIASQTTIEIRPALAADLESLRGLAPPSAVSTFRSRLERGWRCLLAFDGDRLAGYGWLTLGLRLEIDRLAVPLQPGDAYVDDIFTVPAYRRRGVQTLLLLTCMRSLQDEGLKRVVAIVDYRNHRACNLVAKIGWSKVAELTFRRRLWTREFRYDPPQF